MASSGSLVFELAADVSHLRADMAKAQESITSSLSAISKSTAAQALMTGADYAINFARGFAENIKQAIDQIDELNDLSQRIGASSEEISGLGYAAQLSGVKLEDVTNAMRGLSKTLVEAKNPSSAAAKALEAIGLSAAQLKGQNPAQAMRTIAEAFSGFKDGAEKSAVAMAIFGDRVGQKFITFLDQGGAGLDSLTQEAKNMGVTVSTEAAQAIGDLNDDIDRMKAASHGAYTKLAIDLAPAIKELTRLMTEAGKESGTMADGLETIGTAAKATIATLIGLGGTVASLAAVTQGFAGLAASLTKPGGMNEGLDAMAAGWAKGQNIMYETVNSMDAISHKLTEQEKQEKKTAAATREAAAAREEANKKDLAYDPSTKTPKTAHAKKTIDEYSKMLDDLNKKMVTLMSQDNPMTEMLADPKFQKLTQAQQENIKELMNDYLDLKAATDQEKQAQADLDKEYQKNADTIAAFNKSIESSTQSQLDAIDPLRVNAREMAEYSYALDHTIINLDQFNKLQEQSSKKLHDSLANIDPNKKAIKEITDAIDGFGKDSTDAFVSFATGADTAGNSFKKFVSQMLQDMAKMLMYQYVFKGMFSSISTGVGEFLKYLPSTGTASVSAPQVPALSANATLGYNAPATSGTGGGSMSGGGGGVPNPAVTVNVHMSKESNKDTEDTTANQTQAADLGKRIAAAVRQVISVEKRTGGLLASPTR